MRRAAILRVPAFGAASLMRRPSWRAYSHPMSGVDTAVSIALGIGLAAAVGFRVFIPLLVVSIGAYSGNLPLDANFAWLGSLSALAMLAVAATVEVLAYYIPAVDNLLDSITSPLALVAGTVVSAAVITDLPPLVKWSTAVIAGGGMAAMTQGLTALLRAKSTAFTGGIGNPVLSTMELGASAVVSVLALLAPLVALALVALFCWLAVRLAQRTLRGATRGRVVPPGD